jgi:hypothetical protein
MKQHELTAYTQEYFPDERQACAAAAWDAYQQSGIDTAKSLINGFYEMSAEAAAEDLRAFDVRHLAEDHNVALVSAIRSYGNLGPFRPQNREDFKGARLFDVLLRPGQIACCSTVAEGDGAHNLYGSWGIIVGEGTIHQAFPYDATTSVSHGQIESKFMSRIAGIRPTEQINQALHARHLYNEINASIKSIGGLFYCIDEEGVLPQDFPSKVFRDVIAPYDIPQYLLKQGKFYSIESLDDINLGIHNEAVDPSNIVKQAILPTENQQQEMIGYLAENLTLAPRNAITSGVARGQFAYDYRRISPKGNLESFYREQKRLIGERNPSLRLYGAMALHAFAELADTNNDTSNSDRARTLAMPVLRQTGYERFKARILPTGNLQITEDDLRHYLTTEKLPEHLQDH